jgi:transglutaminase-like putative cysteine protease
MTGFTDPSTPAAEPNLSVARFQVRHQTIYQNSMLATACSNYLHLHPADRFGQHVYRFHLEISPEPALLTSHRDAFGNLAHYVEVHRAHHRLCLRAESEVVIERSPPAYIPTMPWEMVRDGLQLPATASWLEAAQFAFPSNRVRWCSQMVDYARESLEPGRPLLIASEELTRRVHSDFIYDPEATHVATSVSEAFAKRRGVCQDLSHILVALFRSHGLAAAYVSGYLRTIPPPGQPKLLGADASHAWVSVFAGADGWLDFDPTNNCRVHLDHIMAARGRDYDDVAPVQGVATGGGRHSLEVEVDVTSLL